MHAFRHVDQEHAGLVGWGVRVLLLAPEGETRLAEQIAGFGGRVDCETELYAAIAAVADDPGGWSLFIVACDAFGGMEAARRAWGLMGDAAERMSMIMIASECERQIFPEDRRSPIVLRAPASAVSLRVGFEHAMRDRIGWWAS